MDDNEFKRKVLEDNEKMIALMETMTYIFTAIHANDYIVATNGESDREEADNNLQNRISNLRNNQKLKKSFGLK